MLVRASAHLAVVLFALTASLPSFAAVVYVNKNMPGAAHDGKSWSTAFTTVQAGVDAASAGDEVWVAAATYLENITVANAIALYGGFAGAETQRSQRDCNANPTVLDGARAGTVVVVPNNLASRSVIDGFTIRNGYAPLVGGIVVAGTATISNCTLDHCTAIAWDSGGGAIAVSGSAEIHHNTITANVAFYGGGIYVTGNANIHHNRISNNLANNRGGGICVGAGSAVIRDNLISSNNAYSPYYGGGGGGASVEGSSAVVVNNTFVANNALNGGALSTLGPTALTNNIIAFNSSGIWFGNHGVSVKNCDVYANTSFNYKWMDDLTGSYGNVSVDPKFVDRASGDFHIRYDSPCREAGDNSAVVSGDTDLDGTPRIRGARVDMGTYEALAMPTVSVSLGASAGSSPAAADGAVYVNGLAGKVYAFTSPALQPVLGFPVDISAAVGTPVQLNSRPAVYFGKTGKAIYLTTNLGHVVKVMPNGNVAWIEQPLGGPAVSTPAVTPDGNVYVDLGLGSSSVLNFVFKLDETTGQPKYISPYLGSSQTGSTLDRSPAIDGRYCYLNASTSNLGSLAVLNQDNLTVRASFAPGEEALPPFLSGGSVFVATEQGNLYKVNGITMSPDLAFGSLGAVKVGEAITAGPFLYQGKVYIGTGSGRVFRVDAFTAARSLFFDSGTGSAITGLLIAPAGILAFTTASGTLQQVPMASPAGREVTSLGGAPAGGPVYDLVQGRLFVVTTAGRLYSIPVAQPMDNTPQTASRTRHLLRQPLADTHAATAQAAACVSASQFRT